MERRWIEDRLKTLPGKNKSGLGRALGLAPARITEIIQGNRSINAAEIAPMAVYLEVDEKSIVAKESAIKAAPFAPDVDPREDRLIKAFNSLDPDDQDRLVRMAEQFARK